MAESIASEHNEAAGIDITCPFKIHILLIMCGHVEVIQTHTVQSYLTYNIVLLQSKSGIIAGSMFNKITFLPFFSITYNLSLVTDSYSMTRGTASITTEDRERTA